MDPYPPGEGPFTYAAHQALHRARDFVKRYRFRFSSERQLQDGIAQLLADVGEHAEREHVLSSGDRVDFLVHPGVALEVKVGGSRAALTRQLHRYAQCPEVQALLVVSSRMQLALLPASLNGKPVAAVSLVGSAL
jgi:hypothetical protein